MRRQRIMNSTLIVPLLCLLPEAAPLWGQDAKTAEPPPAKAPFKPEELEQLVAPIALHPDSLISQILIASTYPLEVVAAARWVKANPNLKGDRLTAALEKQTWDPSVKSLINFPQVIAMMDEKLEWTQKLGDAFLAQQKNVLDAIQRLRAKAQKTGNLKTTQNQEVVVEEGTQTIVIQPADPQVIYVPTYNPTVVYGTWPYPAYPPYYYYPPSYVAGTAAVSFGAGVAVGVAWGYAWGGCNWHGGEVDIDVNKNINVNQNINRERYKDNINQGTGKGTWQHDASHRKGVSYRDQATAQRYNQGSTAATTRSSEAFRGRAEAGRTELTQGAGTKTAGGASSASRASTTQSKKTSAFEGYGPGSDAKSHSSRGSQSRQSSSRPSRPAGGGGVRR